MADDWKDLKPSSWVVPGHEELFLAVLSREKSGGNRLPERKRLYRDGVKLNNTGAEGDDFNVEFIFHNKVTDNGTLAAKGPQMWPDRIEAFERSLKAREVGTLNLPWERGIRCRPQTWTRKAMADRDRGGETMTVRFRVDNEESLDAAAIQIASVRASVGRLARETVFNLEREGMSGDLAETRFDDEDVGTDAVRSLEKLADDLEEALAAPDDYQQTIQERADRLRRATERLERIFTRPFRGRDQMTQPEGSRARVHLVALRERAAAAGRETRTGIARPIARRFEVPRNIYDVAREFEQEPRRLIALNRHIDDLSHIPAGTPVLVEQVQ